MGSGVTYQPLVSFGRLDILGMEYMAGWRNLDKQHSKLGLLSFIRSRHLFSFLFLLAIVLIWIQPL